MGVPSLNDLAVDGTLNTHKKRLKLLKLKERPVLDNNQYSNF